MEEKKNKDFSSIAQMDVRAKVMEKIRNEKISMRSPKFFLLQKLALCGILFLIAFGSAVLGSMIFGIFSGVHFTGTNEGIKIMDDFFLLFPFDHVALLLALFLLADIVVGQIRILPKFGIALRSPAVLLLTAIIFLGGLLVGIGENETLKCWYEKQFSSYAKQVESLDK
ncbi:MAG TPA: hypothetical protein DIT25_01015 [Candidatus Moranbacteria bacterium]|nr:hypothetical protein [Candidatus Moranbacteria bacterium]